MRLDLPPLNSLRAFEAAARHLNLHLAADELCVTKGAVSLQIKRLEEAAGAALFDRGGGRLRLTEAGRTYGEAVRHALKAIELATVQLRRGSARQPLSISCTPGFAVQWLLPRLARFEAIAPAADVRIKASNRIADFVRDGIDFAVRHGRGDYGGMRVHKLFDDELIVVAAPNGPAPPQTDQDWRQCTLLHDEHRGDWRLWLEAAGFSGAPAERGPVLTDSNGVVEAARAGRGLALLPVGMIQSELAQGTLTQCFPGSMKGRLAYYLVYPEPATPSTMGPQALQFRDWMLAEAGLPPADNASAGQPGGK